MRPALIWGTLLIIILDQFSKFYVRDLLALGETRHVVPGVLSITHVINYGIGFGLFQGMVPFVIAASVFIICGLVYYYKSFPDKPIVSCSFALLLGGSFGNLIDRIFFGYVTDFLNIHIWPVFNIADSAVSIGGFLLLFLLYREE